MTKNTIYRARNIITMNPSRPEAEYVAVRDGRILAVGDLDTLASYGSYTLSSEFSDKILVPGFVEGHAHATEGSVWAYTYVGYTDRYSPEGKLCSGAQDIDSVVDVLRRAEMSLSSADEPLFAWGFDPIYFGTERISVRHLDRVSQERPVLVLHSNGHLMNVNSKALELAGITRETNVFGILKDDAGDPTGELMELAAAYMVYRKTGNPFFGGINLNGLMRYSRAACNAGVTTATDLFASFDDVSLAAYDVASRNPDFCIRLLPAMNTLSDPFEEGIARVRKAMTQSNEKLFYGLCKVMTDGSIQGFTGRLKWPGYHTGDKNGLWNMPPDQLAELVMAYHRAGLHLHIHTNGDEASEVMIDAIEAALDDTPRADHRHTLQHCQMADAAQFARMAKLGICVNLFSCHLYYWGDKHYAYTMGPERAWRMDACKTAQRFGVPFAVHTDAPVTPMDSLFAMWSAVNRTTMSGMVLGPEECIDAYSALHAITLGAAYTLKMDHLVGSIESGKFADFAVLERDPLRVPAAEIKDIPLWGTVVGGVPFQAAIRG